MILQALDACYELMANDARFTVPMPGYSSQNCSFALVVDEAGRLLTPVDLRSDKRGVQMNVPLQKGRSGKNPPPYFLCENCKYLLGAVYDKKEAALIDCSKNLAAAADLHAVILANVADAGARAVLRFFARRQAGDAVEIEASYDFYSAGFAVFKFEGDSGYIHERPLVRQAWLRYLDAQENGGTDQVRGQCLLTGDADVPIARIHTLTKGVLGGKATGGSLVGFNFDAVESYGKSQSYNAPVSEAAMFRYTTALNALLARAENRLILGDMTCVIWTEREIDGHTVDQLKLFFSGEEIEAKAELRLDVQGVQQVADVLLRAMFGREITDDMLTLKKSTRFYILGLAPNSARLAVRFWYQDTFGHFTEHIAAHFLDMEIVKGEKAKRVVSVRDILFSMAVGGKSDNVPKTMERALLHAIVSGSEYPAGVYMNLLLRIRAEAGCDFAVDQVRAGFIKAYLKRKYRKEQAEEKEEAITVSLNEESKNVPYVLGRLFAVLERLQESAGNKNLRERYFAAASTNPQVVFPSILKLSQSHLIKVSKSNPQKGVFFDKLCGTILEKLAIEGAFPDKLTLEEQGCFILGYYHQRQFFYMPKVKKDLNEAEAEISEEAE